MLPIYWLVNMSLKTNTEITTGLTLWPREITFENYVKIFTDPSWYGGYINSLTYVIINTVLSISLALPAAYAFSRYRFLGDKHLFFWLLSNRMAPPAVFALPFFNLYSAIGLFDTPWAVALAHCLFNVPLAVWILEGFMSGVPREIDETAAIDGYSFPRFFVKIFMPLIASGIGVAAFFCFMFSWVELLLARTLTAVNAKPIAATMTRTVSAAGMDWGLARRGRRSHDRAGRARDLVRAQLHCQGLRPGTGVMEAIRCPERPMPDLAWMAWTWQTALVLRHHRLASADHDGAGGAVSGNGARSASCASRRRAATGSSSRCSVQRSSTSPGSGSSARTCGGRSASRLLTRRRCSATCEDGCARTCQSPSGSREPKGKDRRASRPTITGGRNETDVKTR